MFSDASRTLSPRRADREDRVYEIMAYGAQGSRLFRVKRGLFKLLDDLLVRRLN